jgi:hypothetical protein
LAAECGDKGAGAINFLQHCVSGQFARVLRNSVRASAFGGVRLTAPPAPARGRGFLLAFAFDADLRGRGGTFGRGRRVGGFIALLWRGTLLGLATATPVAVVAGLCRPIRSKIILPRLGVAPLSGFALEAGPVLSPASAAAAAPTSAAWFARALALLARGLLGVSLERGPVLSLVVIDIEGLGGMAVLRRFPLGLPGAAALAAAAA